MTALTTPGDRRWSPVRRVAAVLLVICGLVASAACTDDDGPGSADGASGSEAGDGPAAAPASPCGPEPALDAPAPDPDRPAGKPGPVLEGSLAHVIPLPVEATGAAGRFVVDPTVEVVVDDPNAVVAACLLREELARTTGRSLPVRAGESDARPDGTGGGDDPARGATRTIRFRAVAGAPEAGRPTAGGPHHAEGYRLTTTADAVTVEASAAAGHGWAVQTLLQSAAPAVHSPFVTEATLTFPAGTVTDAPRFGWRGIMIDIARHHFRPADLERVVDLMAGYKLNVLHLHLTDDQGWRLAIDAYPALTEVGGATEVGGGPGGFLSKEAYRGLVAYAARRGVTVVPEIDLPGHTNAALVSVPELTCDGIAPEPYTGTSVGFSSLCIGRPEVRTFVRTVLAEVAEMTPGPYLHIGGDESHATDPDDFATFIAETDAVVRELGKVPVGWEEVGRVPGDGPRVVQHWLDAGAAEAAVGNGASLVLSPSSTVYFDMAYGPFAPDGNSWAGTTDTREVHDWDPLAEVPVAAEHVLGVEAPLWTELVETPDEIDLRLLPRLPALAEVAWSPPAGRSWERFRTRLAAHAARWEAAGRSYVSDPGVPWP